MTAQALLQLIGSGLLMGLIYALIAVGLSLIFGLMDVVNFAHGEMLMLAMYATFGLWLFTKLDPVLLLPAVMAVMFCLGGLIYLGVVRYAIRARANAGMVQIFATFGLAIFLQGAAQFFFTPDYRSIGNTWLGASSLSIGGVFLPLAQVVGGAVSVAVFGLLYLLLTRSDLGRALEATREDKGAVALVGINADKVFAIGWGIGGALLGIAGAVVASFYYVYPGVGAGFALTAYVTVALGGFGSIFGALAAGVIVGLVEALTTLVAPASLKSLGIFAVYLLVISLRPRGLFGRI